MLMMFSWLKWRSSLISLRVRRQNIEWSNGVMRLIATFLCVGMCTAELPSYQLPYTPMSNKILLTRQSHRHPRLRRPRLAKPRKPKTDWRAPLTYELEHLIVAPDGEIQQPIVHGSAAARRCATSWWAEASEVVERHQPEQ